MVNSIKSVEDALLAHLAPVATSIGCKVELLPENYYRDQVGGSTHRNRHAFISFRGQDWSEPISRGHLTITQKVKWNWQLIVSAKELRTHQGVYAIAQTFQQALIGTSYSPHSSGTIFIESVLFDRLEDSGGIWIVVIKFAFYENFTSGCAPSLLNA